MRLKDKIAIVTGTGTGMGRAIAIRFAREGAHVVGADINETAGRDTAAAVGAGQGAARAGDCIAGARRANPRPRRTQQLLGAWKAAMQSAAAKDHEPHCQICN